MRGDEETRIGVMFVHLQSFYVIWRYLSQSRTTFPCAVSTGRFFLQVCCSTLFVVLPIYCKTY